MKHIKKLKNDGLRKADTSAMENIYKVRAPFANGVYLTGIFRDKTTNVRLTFTETIPELNKDIPVSAIIMPIEDLQAFYNLMTTMLENFRKAGRIE